MSSAASGLSRSQAKSKLGSSGSSPSPGSVSSDTAAQTRIDVAAQMSKIESTSVLETTVV
jgi:hypothetical protein